MYKFYKAILYSPMNEQIYSRFSFFLFLYNFFSRFMGDEKLKLLLRYGIYLYENYNIVTKSVAKNGKEDGLVYGVMRWWWCG